jgi:hypothetical protein
MLKIDVDVDVDVVSGSSCAHLMMHSNNASTRAESTLAHDDRVDAVTGAVAHSQRAMMIDDDQAAQATKGGADRGRDRDFTSKTSISPPTAACGSMESGWQPGAASAA